MREEITLLLALQNKDQQHADLLLQIRQQEAHKVQVERKLEEERAAAAGIRQHLEQLQHDSRLKNLEVDELDTKIREYQKQLDKAIISYKEMEALRTKISNQRQRISEMEDAALSLMDDIEAAGMRLAEAEERLAGHEKEFVVHSQKIASRIMQLQEEIASCEKERADVALKIDAHLLTSYEHLRTKCDNPVVAITDGACSGCKLKLSGITVQRARNGIETITCENCSRLLYIR